MASFRRQIGNAEESEASKKRADLLMANIFKCNPGDESVEVDDWETGEKITVALDPA